MLSRLLCVFYQICIFDSNQITIYVHFFLVAARLHRNSDGSSPKELDTTTYTSAYIHNFDSINIRNITRKTKTYRLTDLYVIHRH